MKKISVKNYQFDGTKLKMLIEMKSNNLDISKSKIRTYMMLCMDISRQTLSAWENSNPKKIRIDRNHSSCPGINYLMWMREFFETSNIDCMYREM